MTTTPEVPMPEPMGHAWEGGRFLPAYTADQVRDTAIAYADARCEKLQAECDGKQKQIHRRANAMNAVYDELQRVAPWSESNDMDWADEMICGIGLLVQDKQAAERERDYLVEEYERAVKCGQQGYLHCAMHLFNAITNARIDATVASRERDEARVSRDFYQRRCDMLQAEQKRMRDPERTLVCDILANGQLLPDPHGKRYGAIDSAMGEQS